MTIRLEDPLDLDNLSQTQQAVLQDLQGNILKGHGREHVAHVFLRFDAPDPARRYLRLLGGLVTSASDQVRASTRLKDAGAPFSGQLFLGIALSAAGYRTLGIKDDLIPNDPAFTDGMRKHGPITLLDPDVSTWDKTFREDIHVILIIAHDTDEITRTYQQMILSHLPAGVSPIREAEVGTAICNPAGQRIEHFGYADGVSSPVFFKQDLEGHTTSNWNPLSALRLVLAKCPGGDENSYGSYLVFRKLEQNVRRYAGIEQEFAQALSAAGPRTTPADAGALIIGRRKDGTSLMFDVPGEPISNDFNYEHDPGGAKCPFGSHARKLNPRGGTSPSSPNWSNERKRFVVRRGITYGQRKDKPWEDLPPDARPPGGVGLFFMCYQASIQDQFEKLQREWANDGWFPRDPPGFYGVDPLIGRPNLLDKGQVPAWAAPEGRSIKFAIQQCVNLRGGEYFFTPSLSFFRSL